MNWRPWLAHLVAILVSFVVAWILWLMSPILAASVLALSFFVIYYGVCKFFRALGPVHWMFDLWHFPFVDDVVEAARDRFDDLKGKL